MVEAKALGKDLEGARGKAFDYAYQNGVPYYVVTDGLRWEIYAVAELDPNKRRFVTLNLTEETEGQAARKLLALWRPGMPILEIPPSCLISRRAEVRGTPPQHKGGLPLEELERRMMSGELPRGCPPPQRIIFPNGEETPTRYWKDLLLAAVEWASPRLAGKLPLAWPSTGRIIIARDTLGMREPRGIGSYWVETHASAFYLVKYANFTLKKVGQDPSSVQVVLR